MPVSSVQSKWSALFGLWALHGIFSLGQFLASNNSPLALSFEELLLAGALLLWSGLNLFLIFSTLRKSAWLLPWFESLKSPNVKDRLFIFATLALALRICLWIFQSIADRSAFGFVGYIDRLTPLLDLAAIVLAEIVLLILFFSLRETSAHKNIPSSFWWKLLIVLSLLGMIAFYISQTGMGIAPLYKGDWARGLPAVPLLEWQILLACLFYAAMAVFERRAAWKTSRLDFWIALFIWVATAAFWLAQPIVPSSSALEPIEPNFEIYPFSDAQTYDEYAQSVLVGNGFGQAEIPQRPLYIVFLIVLHALSGQDYNTLIALQSLAFALFPVLLYLFGREFLGRPLGISIALLAVLRDYTSNLVSPFTGNISYSKLYLAEIPTAMFLILFLLVGMRWIKSGFPASSSFLLGGILGIAMLIRTQVVVAFPMLLLFAFFTQPKRIVPIIKGALLASAAIILAVSPWLWRNWKMTGQLIFDNPESQMANLALRYNRLNGIDVDIMALPGEANSEYNERLVALASQAINQNPLGIAGGIASSFLNHGVSNILLFPLRNTLGGFSELWTPVDPFWQKWEGAPTFSQSVLIGFYVLLFGLGLGVAWHKNGWLGLLPLAVNLVYNLWTSLALLSGQRFLVAMDWSIYLYYMIGLSALLGVFLSVLQRGRSIISTWYAMDAALPAPVPSAENWRRYLAAGALFFAVSASLPFSEAAFPKKYPPVEQADLLNAMVSSDLWENASLDLACFHKVVTEHKLTAAQGRALYPRYYEAGGGEWFTDSAGYKAADEGRLVFQVFGQFNGRVIFPMSAPPDFFPNASDVTLLFDAKGNAWFILVEQDGMQRMYFSETLFSPACK